MIKKKNLGLLEKKRNLEERTSNRRNAKLEAKRGERTAVSGVSRTAGGQSQALEVEAELLSAEANNRRLTKCSYCWERLLSKGNGDACHKCLTKTLRKSAKKTRRVCKKFGKGLAGKGCWPFLDSWYVVDMRTTTSSWNIPSKYGPRGELFFVFLLKKEPTFHREVVYFGRDAPSDTEDGESFSGDNEEYNMENFMLCPCAHFRTQPALAGRLARRGVV